MDPKRFYVTPQDIDGQVVQITGNEYRHMTGVLRYKVGYQAIVCDNSGYDYLCTVTAIDKSKAVLHIDNKVKNATELGFPLSLCCGLIKPEKFDIEVQKAVELGVTDIQPFISQNTSETKFKQDRIERIVTEACKQCGRAVLPRVLPTIKFEELFNKYKKYYMAYEKEEEKMLRNVLVGKPNEYGVSIIIGSEGGFTEEEARYAKQHGAILFSLGKRILRAETAAIVALGTIGALTEII